MPTVTFTIKSQLQPQKTAGNMFDTFSTALKDTKVLLEKLKKSIPRVTKVTVDSLTNSSPAPPAGGGGKGGGGGGGSSSSNSSGSASSDGGGSMVGIGAGVGVVVLLAAGVAYWYFYMRKAPMASKADDHIPTVSTKMHARSTMDNPMMAPNSRDSIPLFLPQPLSADAAKRASTWDSPSGAPDYGGPRLDPAYDVNNPMQSGGGRLSQALGSGSSIVNQSALFSSHAGTRTSVMPSNPAAHPTQEEL